MIDNNINEAYRLGQESMRDLAVLWVDNNYSTNPQVEQIKYSLKTLPIMDKTSE